MKTKITIILLLWLGSICILKAQNIIESTQVNYRVTTDYYTLLIPKNSGMIESLKLTGSEFEIVSDYPDYSVFFPEYVAEHSDGLSGTFIHPPRHPEFLSFENPKNTPTLAILKVAYNTGEINSYWTYVFRRDTPTFRASVKRVVVKSGVYSNAQQCVMYSVEMDQSGLIDYAGRFQITMGNYAGNFPFVTWPREGVPDASPNTSPHSLWTNFDYGSPKYFPMFMWRNSAADITAGVMTTWTSPNQRESVSYHGGGNSRVHPGYAEGQWNWFGKTDSESLYLTAGTTYSMELIYYQNYGPVDSLLSTNTSLFKNDGFLPRSVQDYRAASWGGRTSAHDRYFWRYPQATSNDISTQRLFRHESFAIPRSQNGLRDSHLFSLYLKAAIADSIINLAPNDGHLPLFSSLNNGQTDTSFIGEMSWVVSDIVSELTYELPFDQSVIHVSGSFNLENTNLAGLDSIWVELSTSNRSQIQQNADSDSWSFWAPDTLLDTIAVNISRTEGFLETHATVNALKLLSYSRDAALPANIFSFSFDCIPSVYRSNTLNDVSLYRSYFTRVASADESVACYIEPSSKYFCIDALVQDTALVLTFWVDEASDSIYLYYPNALAPFISDVLFGRTLEIEPTVFENIYMISGGVEPGFHILRLNDSPSISFQSNLTIFPNPGIGDGINFYVAALGRENGSIRVFNLLGQEVFQFNFTTNNIGITRIHIPINKIHLSNGLYYTSIDYSGTKYFQKLVIVR